MKKLIVSTIFLINFVLTFSQMGPSLYPGIIEMNLNKGNGQGKFTVFNQNDTPKKYKVSIRNLDNQGNTSELSPYLRVFPKFISLNPGENQDVRVIAKKFPGTEVGEYRSSLLIEELESNIEEKYDREQQLADGVGAQINFLINVGMAVYAYVGELEASIDTDLQIEDNKLSGRIINTGNYSFPVKYIAEGTLGTNIGEGTLTKIIRGYDANVDIELPDGTTRIKLLESTNEVVLSEIDL